MEEKLVIDRLKGGDAEAFTILYNRYWLKVYNFAQLYIISSSELSEVVQDVFLKVWESKEILDADKNIDSLVAQLPPKRQQIFKMSREEHLSCKEIAERCGVGEKAVERQITLALKFLKDNLPLFMLFVRVV